MSGSNRRFRWIDFEMAQAAAQDLSDYRQRMRQAAAAFDGLALLIPEDAPQFHAESVAGDHSAAVAAIGSSLAAAKQQLIEMRALGSVGNPIGNDVAQQQVLQCLHLCLQLLDSILIVIGHGHSPAVEIGSERNPAGSPTHRQSEG